MCMNYAFEVNYRNRVFLVETLREIIAKVKFDIDQNRSDTLLIKCSAAMPWAELYQCWLLKNRFGDLVKIFVHGDSDIIFTREYQYVEKTINESTLARFCKTEQIVPLLPIPDTLKQRVNAVPALIFAGCSITNGIGVKKHESFAEILKTQVPDYHYYNISLSGSSIEYSAACLLLLDCKAGDVVIWGLTGCFRTFLVHPKRLIHYIHNNLSYKPWSDIVQSKQHVFHCCSLIQQVIDYYAAKNVTLIIADLMFNWHVAHYGYIDLYNKIVDSGDDAIIENNAVLYKGHPGPKTHRYYADKIYQKLIELRPDLLK